MRLPFGRFIRFFHRGLRFARRRRFEEAAAWMKKAHEIDPMDTRVLVQYGLALAEGGRYGEAVEVLEKAADLRPDEATFYFFLGVIHMDAGNHDLSLNAFERAMERDDSNRIVQSFAALSRWENGNRDEGVRALLDEEYVQSSRFESRLLVKVEESIGELEEEDFRAGLLRTMEAAPRFPWLASLHARRARNLAARAAALLEKDRYERAMILLERASELHPRDQGVQEGLVKARKQRIKACRAGLKKNGNDPDLLFEAGCLSFENREFEEAEKYLMKWMDLRRQGNTAGKSSFEESQARRMLAENDMARKNYAAAGDALEKLCADDPEDYTLRYLLGVCHTRRRDRAAARAAFEPFLDREPSFARLRLKELSRIAAWKGAGPDCPAREDPEA